MKTKKQPEGFHETLGISYLTALDNLRKLLAPFFSSVSDFGTHSLKSGGASNSAFKKADPELKDRHAGWKNPASKLRYMKRSVEELLDVTKSM